MSYEEQKNCDCGTDCDCHDTVVEERPEEVQISQENNQDLELGGCGCGCGCQ